MVQEQRFVTLRTILRVLVALLTTILVPTAINVATGGSLGPSFTWASDWVWPFVGVAAVPVIALVVLEGLTRRNTVTSSRPEEPKNRKRALAQVKSHVERQLTQGVPSVARVNVAVDSISDAVNSPAEVFVQPVGGVEPVTGVKISVAFARFDDSLLLLGAPGSGKTTLLLELCSALLERAYSDPEAPIPVTINLGGRPGKTRESSRSFTLLDLLKSELYRIYTIPPALTVAWLERGMLSLLIDGLDEANPEDRNRFVGEINALQSRYVIPQIVVCCRDAVYRSLTDKLQLRVAVKIRPLTRRQIVEYFAIGGESFDGLRLAAEADEGIAEFANTPLLIGIMSSVLVGECVEVILSAQGRDRMLDTYLRFLFAREEPAENRYSSEKTARWMTTFAYVGGGRHWLSLRLLPDRLRDWVMTRLCLDFIGAAMAALVTCIAINFSFPTALAPVLLGTFVLFSYIRVLEIQFSSMFNRRDRKLTPSRALTLAFGVAAGVATYGVSGPFERVVNTYTVLALVLTRGILMLITKKSKHIFGSAAFLLMAATGLYFVASFPGFSRGFAIGFVLSAPIFCAVMVNELLRETHAVSDRDLFPNDRAPDHPWGVPEATLYVEAFLCMLCVAPFSIAGGFSWVTDWTIVGIFIGGYYGMQFFIIMRLFRVTAVTLVMRMVLLADRYLPLRRVRFARYLVSRGVLVAENAFDFDFVHDEIRMHIWARRSTGLVKLLEGGK